LKEVAYDVDDVVDAFQLEAQKHEAQHYGDIVSKYLHSMEGSQRDQDNQEKVFCNCEAKN
jgi:hypothetical protein